MSLYRRPGSRYWWIKLSAPGAPTLRESTGTADRAAAQEYHDRRAAELWRVRRLGERARTAFAAAAADWIETHARHKRSFADDRARLRVMLPLLPEWLDELTTARLTTLRDALRAPREVQLITRAGRTRKAVRQMGPSTANKYLALLSAILHHAHRREWIAAVPAIPMYPQARRRRFAVLNADEAAALLAAMPPHLAAIARFALATGLRDANVRGLRWADVDLAARVARVWPEDAKAGQAIPVPLNSAAIEVLRAQLGRHPTHVFVYERLRARPSGAPEAFVADRVQTARGERVLERVPIGKRTNNTAWRKARERAGLGRLRVHDLRHTWATWHKRAGTPDLELQQMGGWSDSRMLRVYAHLAAEHLLEHAERIDVQGTAQGTAATEEAASTSSSPNEINDLGGVADGIRTHNNRNHNPVGRIVRLDKSTTCETQGKPKTAKRRA